MLVSHIPWSGMSVSLLGYTRSTPFSSAPLCCTGSSQYGTSPHSELYALNRRKVWLNFVFFTVSSTQLPGITRFILTCLKQGAALGQRVEDSMWEESRVVQQLVLMLDAVAAVYKVQVGLFWWTLRGWAAACTAAQHVQVTVVSTCVLWGQRQVEKQAFRQRGNVIQIAEGGAGASSVGAAVVDHVTILLAGANSCTLLGLLVLLDLCIQAVTLLFGHSTKLDRCNRRMQRQKLNTEEGNGLGQTRITWSIQRDKHKVGGGNFELIKYGSSSWTHHHGSCPKRDTSAACSADSGYGWSGQ